jgi:hypothetical protein
MLFLRRGMWGWARAVTMNNDSASQQPTRSPLLSLQAEHGATRGVRILSNNATLISNSVVLFQNRNKHFRKRERSRGGELARSFFPEQGFRPRVHPDARSR